MGFKRSWVQIPPARERNLGKASQKGKQKVFKIDTKDLPYHTDRITVGPVT